MIREDLTAFILENYNAKQDYPWADYPNYTVFRHATNKKWFALIMDIPRSKLGMKGEKRLDVVNFKCDFKLIGSLLKAPGFFPAYHMNKASWITVALDGTVAGEKIKFLLDMSYELTSPKVRKRDSEDEITAAKD